MDPIQQTTGLVTAQVIYPNELTFRAESDLRISKTESQFKITAAMNQGNEQVRTIDLWFPVDIPNDGSPHRVSLDTSSENQGRYGIYPEGAWLRSRSGEMTVHYDEATQRMWGTFDFIANYGDRVLSVQNGGFDLTGISRIKHAPGSGTFMAFSEQWGQFDANSEVSISYVDRPLDPRAIGRFLAV